MVLEIPRAKLSVSQRERGHVSAQLVDAAFTSPQRTPRCRAWLALAPSS